jgi:hypothetical protein
MGKHNPALNVFVQSFEENKDQVKIFVITFSGSNWTEVRDHENGNRSVTSVSITVLHGVKILEAVMI